ncbi:MAG: hypothetical protein IPJ09_06575 [Saprospiraceae bacterium]|nr:hypothetical protein [Saprospiraceae bacterium]
MKAKKKAPAVGAFSGDSFLPFDVSISKIFFYSILINEYSTKLSTLCNSASFLLYIFSNEIFEKKFDTSIHAYRL